MITIDDLKDRFGESEINELSQVVEIEQIISDSIDFTESFLIARYKLPFLTVPPVIKSCICSICRYKLYRFEKPPDVSLHYQEAVKFLERLSKGIVNLKIEQPPVAPDDNILILDTMICSVKRRYTDKDDEYNFNVCRWVDF